MAPFARLRITDVQGSLPRELIPQPQVPELCLAFQSLGHCQQGIAHPVSLQAWRQPDSSPVSCELCNCCRCYSSVRRGSELYCRDGAYLQVAVHLIQSLCLARYTIQDSVTIRTYSQELAWLWCWVKRGKYLMKCSWRLLRYIIFLLFSAVYVQCTMFGLIINTNLLITTLVIFVEVAYFSV